MAFDALIEAQLDGRTIKAAALFTFEFVSRTVRVWEGFGRLRAGDGEEYIGAAQAATFTDIEQATDGEAPPFEMTLSGVDADFAQAARAEFADYYWRPVRIAVQFFVEEPGSWEVLGEPIMLDVRLMTTLVTARSPDDKGSTRTVRVAGETPFARRRRARNSTYADADQKARFPGDRGSEWLARLQNMPLKDWPS